MQLRAEPRHLFPQIARDHRPRNIFKNVHEGFDLSLFEQRPDNRIPMVQLCHAANKGILPEPTPVFH